ncbi:MAG: N-acetyltransferase [Nitrospinaceae bacterium]|nr:MAG: N-acetyltransferase [Nitrospinaceae bacterium]
MKIEIRQATPADAETCGRIIYESFKGVSDRHGFPCDFPSVKTATQITSMFIMNGSVFSLVAEMDGSVVGCNFLHEGHPIRSVGPLAVDPDLQNRGIGRLLMGKTMDRAKNSMGIRLIQETSNTEAISLYTSLGFDVKDSLLLIEGKPKNPVFTQGFNVKPLTIREVKRCAKICAEVFGFERTQEIETAVKYFSPFGVIRGNDLTAYASSMTSRMTNHCVAKTDEDMKALILGIGKLTSESFSFLLPVRHSDLFRWCLKEGFRVLKPLTIMSLGHYDEPQGVYFPSAVF